LECIYIPLDDINLYQIAKNNLKGFLKHLEKPVIIDKIQCLPQLRTSCAICFVLAPKMNMKFLTIKVMYWRHLSTQSYLKTNIYTTKRAKLSYYKTSDKKEIDFILEFSSDVIVIEIKDFKSNFNHIYHFLIIVLNIYSIQTSDNEKSTILLILSHKSYTIGFPINYFLFDIKVILT